MRRWSAEVTFVWIMLLAACTLRQGVGVTGAPEHAQTDAHITLLQMNDIYEIMPVNNGKQGGLARAATIRQRLLRQNPYTYTILAGDLLSPSALGVAKVDGEQLAGKHIVAVMNTLGLDYATFGNHEFDLEKSQLYQRLAESTFTWFSGNVTEASGQPFPNVLPSVIINVGGPQPVRLGLIGVTIDSNKRTYVRYRDPVAVVKEQSASLAGQVDILVAVTHLPIEMDIRLAEEVPSLAMILGGHEHENVQMWRGAHFTPIVKADANARSVYIHDLVYNTATKQLRIASRLQLIDADIPAEAATEMAAREWTEKAFKGFEQAGFQPTEMVARTSVALDGLEASVRNKATALTDVIATALLQTAPEADLAMFNGGSIRLDDVLPAGNITQYDILRILPFGGHVVSVEMSGELLARVLAQGEKNRGTGGYLQTTGVKRADGGSGWLIRGMPLDVKATYRVATTDFLISGREHNLEFLNTTNPQLQMLDYHGEIRMAVIRYLRKTLQ